MILNKKNIILSIFILQPWLFNGLIRFDILISVLCILFCSFKYGIRIPIREVLFLLLSISIVLVITLFHAENDYSLLRRYITYSVLIIGSYYVVMYFNVTLNDIIHSIYIILPFCLIFFIFSTQFDFMKDISMLFKGNTYGLENKLEYYRLWFPTSAHTFHWGLFFVVSLVFILNNKPTFINLFFIIFCIACATISARSAMVMCVLVCIVYSISKDIRFLYILLITAIIIAIFVYFFAEHNMAIRYALEPIYKLASTGKLQSGSVDVFFEKHLYLPEIKTIFLGDGKYINSDGSFYGHTDSGIIRPVLYGGIFFQLFYFLFTFRYFKCLFNLKTCGIFLVILLYIANIKAEVLSTTPYLSLILLYYYSNRKTPYDKIS